MGWSHPQDAPELAGAHVRPLHTSTTTAKRVTFLSTFLLRTLDAHYSWWQRKETSDALCILKDGRKTAERQVTRTAHFTIKVSKSKSETLKHSNSSDSIQITWYTRNLFSSNVKKNTHNHTMKYNHDHRRTQKHSQDQDHSPTCKDEESGKKRVKIHCIGFYWILRK